VPLLLCRCTRLTSLDLSMHQANMYDTTFSVGGLPKGFTILRRLQHLRLGDCITEPLACDLSQFTQLTSLEIPSKDLYDHDIHDPGSVAVRCPPSSLCNAWMPTHDVRGSYPYNAVHNETL
jgi:hypothetical protein